MTPAFETWHHDQYGWFDPALLMCMTRYVAWHAARKQALVECANRSEAYAYMSENFLALAEEIRRME